MNERKQWSGNVKNIYMNCSFFLICVINKTVDIWVRLWYKFHQLGTKKQRRISLPAQVTMRQGWGCSWWWPGRPPACWWRYRCSSPHCSAGASVHPGPVPHLSPRPRGHRPSPRSPGRGGTFSSSAFSVKKCDICRIKLTSKWKLRHVTPSLKWITLWTASRIMCLLILRGGLTWVRAEIDRTAVEQTERQMYPALSPGCHWPQSCAPLKFQSAPSDSGTCPSARNTAADTQRDEYRSVSGHQGKLFMLDFSLYSISFQMFP